MGPGGDIFGARIGPQRTIDLNRFQGTAETEKAVLAALRWLKANQERDGSWKCGQSPRRARPSQRSRFSDMVKLRILLNSARLLAKGCST